MNENFDYSVVESILHEHQCSEKAIIAILQDVQELLESRGADFEIRLVTVPDLSIPKFFFDGEQIHRALMNIVSNAIDAIRNARALPENLEITRTTQASPRGMVRRTSS